MYTLEERQTLMRLAKESIEAAVNDRQLEHVPPPQPELSELGAAFVTLKKLDGTLRGCIGHVLAKIPLYKCVSEMARAAAVFDSRFAAVSPGELSDIKIEISILTTPEPVAPLDVKVGRDGLIVRKGSFSGLLLPQVPVEWGWDREQFLAQTCRKAGLPADAWRSPGVQLLAFEAIIFDENDI